MNKKRMIVWSVIIWIIIMTQFAFVWCVLVPALMTILPHGEIGNLLGAGIVIFGAIIGVGFPLWLAWYFFKKL